MAASPNDRVRVYNTHTGRKLDHPVPRAHLSLAPHLKEVPSTKEPAPDKVTTPQATRKRGQQTPTPQADTATNSDAESRTEGAPA